MSIQHADAYVVELYDFRRGPWWETPASDFADRYLAWRRGKRKHPPRPYAGMGPLADTIRERIDRELAR